MNFDFSHTENPISNIAAALRTVYILNADRTYNVTKALKKEVKDIVALRTTGGMGTVKIEGLDELTVLPGTLLFFEHCMVRNYYCSGDRWDFWWFEFTVPHGVLNQPLNRISVLSYDETEQEDYKNCLELLRKSDESSRLLASSLFSHVLCKWSVRLGRSSAANPYQQAIERTIDFMRSKLPESVSVKELAAVSGLCERRFRQVFEMVTGTQPKKYYDTMRIGMAVELLRNTAFSIAEISERLGYSSQFHFTRAFGRIHNMAPLHFRKNNC